MSYDIERVTIDPQYAAVVAAEVPRDEVGAFVERAFGEVMAAIGRQGIAIAGMPFGRFEPVGEVFRAEVGFPTERPIDDTGGVRGIELPGGPAIATLHAGAYDSVGGAYEALHAYLGANRLVPAGGPWESYLDGPEVAVPRTRIVWPVREADTHED